MKSRYIAKRGLKYLSFGRIIVFHEKEGHDACRADLINAR